MAGVQHSPYGQGARSSLSAGSPSANQTSAQPEQTAVHQRTYQACIPCRRRKVRCDLGSVDNPHDPPCLRCRRENKECYFSATRRKRKTDGKDEEVEEEALVSMPGRKKLRAGQDVQAEAQLARPRTPGGSIGNSAPLRRPTTARVPQYGEEDIAASEQTTALLQGAEVHGGHDALKVLVHAASLKERNGSFSGIARPSLSGISPSSMPTAITPDFEKSVPAFKTNLGSGWKAQDSPIPGFSPDQIPTDTPAYALAVKAWSRFKFVRSGWFSVKEGIAYVAYFYKYLSPLTPVTLPDFRPLETHEKLLTREPMLAMTILLIASRHMRLEGPGALTRPITIHHKLWEYVQGMVDRVVWGQEQRRGAFGTDGSQPGSDVNPLTRTGLRTLGTVESLMLLTEWHPRAMHFPPDEADDELMMSDQPYTTPDPDSLDDAKGIGGQRMDSWLGPCWRSDRMCWMLLGMAMSLAFEIGVFDKSEWQRHAISPNGGPMSASELQQYDKRRKNVRDLLLVYVTLTSGRLGLTTMLPGNYSKPEDSDLYKMQIGEHASIQETVLQYWLRIAAIMREGNKLIFANKEFTRDLIKSGMYQTTLQKFQAPLKRWKEDFDTCSVIPKFMRCILQIEYEYCRVYLNALGLQAVAERCANDVPQVNDPPMDLSQPATNTIGTRTDVAIDPQTLAKWLGGDRRYMNEVREAACNLLTIVVDELTPGEYLRHAPVRSYFRIISVAIMLLKSFSLGASENDVSGSLKLMDRTVAAIRTCIVDDMHVASRFADLLDTLLQNLRPRLVRITADGRDSSSRKQSVRSTPAPGYEGVGHAQAQNAVYGQHLQAADMLGGRSLTPAQLAAQDPMSGVTDNSYDLMMNREYSVMPPPSFNNHNNVQNIPGGYAANSTVTNGNENVDDGNGYNMSNYDDMTMQDWYTLPLDPLLELSNVDVNHTMYGPELGGKDMLEYLLQPDPRYQQMQ